jgi:hypothetical protein
MTLNLNFVNLAMNTVNFLKESNANMNFVMKNLILKKDFIDY